MIKWEKLQIKRGEKIFTFAPFQQSKKITFITGKNGYGKTTLLKAIGGLLPYEGDLEVQGSVTYLAQQPVVFNRSVFDNIRFQLNVRKLEI